jgi:hypothetical protein
MRTAAWLGAKQFLSAPATGFIVGAGILLAATLLAGAPIYARAMADAGLTYTLRDQLEVDPRTTVEFLSIPMGTEEGRAMVAAVERRIDERLDWFTEDVRRLIRAGRLTVSGGRSTSSFPPSIEPNVLEGVDRHVRYVAGRAPGPRGDGVIEVALSQRSAQTIGLDPGQRFQLAEDYDNCDRELSADLAAPPPPPCPVHTRVTFSIEAELVGVFEPIDPADRWWPGGSVRYTTPFFLAIEGAGPVLPALVHEAALLDGFAGRYPAYRASFAWFVLARPEALDRRLAARAQDDIRGLGAEFLPLEGYVYGPVADALQDYEAAADYQLVPLLVLMLEVGFIAVFYVGLVASTLVERQAPLVALVRGRGASLGQTVISVLMPGVFLGVPALALGPLVAAGVTALLGLTPLFSGVTGGELFRVTVMPLAFGLAAVGVLLALLAFSVPALIIARRGVTAVRRDVGRPGPSIIQRYYLDVFAAAAAALLLFEVHERGSVFQPSATGGVSSDPLLLASPALAMLAAAALILRFVPLLLRLGARAAPLAGTAAGLAFVQVTRNPGPYTRLTLLLTMAVAVGTFAASYTATADRSYRDRAAFAAATDVRLMSRQQVAGTDREIADLEAALRAIEGVTAATLVIRTEASMAAPGTTGATSNVLAIDPAAIGTQVTWRDDYAAEPVDDLLRRIATPASFAGRTIPDDAEALRLYLRTEARVGGLNLWVGVRGGDGSSQIIQIAALEEATTTWAPFDVALSRLSPVPPKPWTVVSIVVSGLATGPPPPPVFIDNLSAVDAAGNEVLLEGFEEGAPWRTFPTSQATPERFTVVTEEPHAGRNAGRFDLRTGSIPESRGIYLAGLSTPLGILVSESWLAAHGRRVGSEVTIRMAGGTLVPAVVRGAFERFPSIVSREGPVVIFNRDQLLGWSRIASTGVSPLTGPNEAWLATAKGADQRGVAGLAAALGFERSITLDEELAAATDNPLIAASGSGILVASFAGVLVLVGLAFVTTLQAAARTRRVELAVTRVLGVTRAQVVAMLAIEYAAVFVVGIVGGSVLGLFVGRQMLSFLEVDQQGFRVEPPFLLETRWLLVAAGVAFVLAAFAVAVWLVARAAGRETPAEVLRGEG